MYNTQLKTCTFKNMINDVNTEKEITNSKQEHVRNEKMSWINRFSQIITYTKNLQWCLEIIEKIVEWLFENNIF